MTAMMMIIMINQMKMIRRPEEKRRVDQQQG
jgi:hypothetical protein